MHSTCDYNWVGLGYISAEDILVNDTQWPTNKHGTWPLVFLTNRIPEDPTLDQQLVATAMSWPAL